MTGHLPLLGVRLRYSGFGSAPPLPLAGEGWGGGAASGLAEIAPTRLASLGTLPRKREREEGGLESVKKTYQVVGVGLPPGSLRQPLDDINPTSVSADLLFNQT